MIAQNGKVVTFISNFKSLNLLKPINYLMMQNPQTGEYYLEEQDSFTLPKKMYGNIDNLSGRYLNTFANTDKNLGILLKGLKGTGKSLLAKKICIDSGLPVILLTSPFRGVEFNKFISNIKQECIIFIDEFEKIYSSTNSRGLSFEGTDTGSQSGLLTLLDGVFEGKKLFLLTANEGSINNALLNRPGRIHYLKEYSGLTPDIIKEIATDLLDDKKHISQIIEVASIIGNINIDSLITLIKECNLYKESPRESINYLNIKPEASSFKVIWTEKKKPNYLFTSTTNQHPLTASNLYLDGYGEWTSKNKKEADSDYDDYSQLDFTKLDLSKSVIDNNGNIVLKNTDDSDIIVTKKENYKFIF